MSNLFTFYATRRRRLVAMLCCALIVVFIFVLIFIIEPVRATQSMKDPLKPKIIENNHRMSNETVSLNEPDL